MNSKYNKLAIKILICCGSLSLVACNGGGGGSNQQSDIQPKPLAYTYTADYQVPNEYYNELPTVDIRPFASQATVTYTLTNTNSIPVWFPQNIGYSPELFSGRIISGDVSKLNGYAITVGNWSGSCYDYTIKSPLQPNQSCTFTMHIIDQWNYSESELINIGGKDRYSTAGIVFAYYYYPSDSSDSSYLGYRFPANTYVRSGIWYQNQQGYNLGLPSGDIMASMNVVNVGGAAANGGHDYIFPSYTNNNSQPFAVSFDGNGVAQVNTQSPVACSITGVLGCLNGTTILAGAENALIPYNVQSQRYLAAGYGDGSNSLVNGLNKQSYGRGGGYQGIPIPNVKALYAVQKDGTIIGQNINGEYGCFNNDGSNFRAFPALPSGYSLAGANTNVIDTVSYGNTNWISVYFSGSSWIQVAYTHVKVVADNTGMCRLDFNNILTDVTGVISISGAVPQTNQITPNGVYTYDVPTNDDPNRGYHMLFLKYPPRQ